MTEFTAKSTPKFTWTCGGKIHRFLLQSAVCNKYQRGQNYYKKQIVIKKMFWSNQFCKKYKRITLLSKFLGLFSCKKGHASGSNIAKKILWWNYLCNNYKNDYKRKCSKELFCNDFGQDGTLQGGPGSVRLRLGGATVRAVPLFGSGGSSAKKVFLRFSTV